MNNKKLVIIGFVIVVILQLLIPAKTIFDRENVLSTGTPYKFITAPIDPNDPFRGKYITLWFNENSIDVPDSENWAWNETVYVQFKPDESGYAIIKSISKSAPEDTEDYLETVVSNVYPSERSGFTTVTVKYPFTRFYMEESKAFEAELLYNNQGGCETAECETACEEGSCGDCDFAEECEGGDLCDSGQACDGGACETGDCESAVCDGVESEILAHCDEVLDVENLCEEANCEEASCDGGECDSGDPWDFESDFGNRRITYALVYIKNGRAVLKDVIFDDMPIKDAVLEEREHDNDSEVH